MDSYLLANAESVVARARAGNEAALEELYRAFEAPVYNLARRICRTTEDAEDVLQETFFEVCRSIGRYREEGSLWGWVRTIASSKALMRLRRNKYRDTDELQEEVTRPAPRGHRACGWTSRPRSSGCPRRRARSCGCTTSRATPTTRSPVMMGKTPSFSKSQLARAHQRLRRWLGEEVEA